MFLLAFMNFQVNWNLVGPEMQNLKVEKINKSLIYPETSQCSESPDSHSHKTRSPRPKSLSPRPIYY